MKNSKLRKVLLLACSAVLLVCLSVGVTLAYLADKDTVVNTFTVGNVNIKLDEAKANPDGSLVKDADRVQGNEYKLLPGHLYNKDPMVTVLEGSEKCYVKMTVTFTKAKELDEIFTVKDADGNIIGGADLTSIFGGYSASAWEDKGNSVDTVANTRTYEFWYTSEVDALNKDVELPALFKTITVPGSITNEQLETINGMTITVNAYAIQSDGFANAAAAWEKFTVPAEKYEPEKTPATDAE